MFRSLSLVPFALFFTGCALEQPFDGPGFKNGALTTDAEGPFVVATTRLDVKDDGDADAAFGKHMEAMQKALPEQKGLVGFSLAGVGAPASLPLPVGPDGRTLDQIVYAPHLYDAFVDSGQPWDGDARRLARTMERHVAHARRLGVPLVVGEWGHLNPSAQDPAGVATAALDLLDDAQAGAAYWEHRPGAEAGLFRHAVRPFVARAAGRVVSTRFDGRRFELRLAPGGTGPTVVTAPTLVWSTPPRVRVTSRLTSPPATGPAEAAYDPATNTVLVWTAPGATGEVTLVIEP